MESWLIPAPVLIPLGAAFALPLVGRVSLRLRPVLAVLAAALTVAALLVLAEPVFVRRQILVYWMGGWTPRAGLAIGISLTIDAWGLLFALIAAAIGLAAVLYSTSYIAAHTGRGVFFTLLLLVIAALVGFCLSGDVFNQFVWLEVFSVAAFALTAFHVERRESVEAAFKYLVTNSAAAMFIATALALLYMQTGALNLAGIAAAFKPTTAGLVAVALLLGGYATKAALAPWHFWLPDAHAAAPAPISALFSGALIEIGIYAAGRIALTLYPFQTGDALQFALLAAGMLSMLVGSLQLLRQQDPKRLLAYSSVAQMGYILLALSLVPGGVAAAALYSVHHALVKGALFLGIGAVIWRHDIHSLEEGGNLARAMPVTCAAMVVAALGLSGMPFTSGFVAKEMLEEAAVRSGLAVGPVPLTGAIVAWVVLCSALTFAGMVRLLWFMFGPRPGAPPRARREAPVAMLVPLVGLAVGSLVVGTLPQPAVDWLAAPAGYDLLQRGRYVETVLGPGVGQGWQSLEESRPAAPAPWDLLRWGPTLVALAGGAALAYVLFGPAAGGARHPALRPARALGAVLRGWHSGYVGDYALWGAFGTAVLVMLALIR